MADLGTSLKSFLMKGMESIGNAATSIANNTKTKVSEMNMVNRRNEILSDFGNRAYALWLKGETFPPELDGLLKELNSLDERLNDLRAEKYASIKEKAGTAAGAAVSGAASEKAPAEDAEAEVPAEGEETETAAEYTGAEADTENGSDEAAPEEAAGEEGVPVIRVEREADPVPEEKKVSEPLNDAIQELFDKAPDAESIEKKVNGTLDTIQDSMNQLTKEIDEGLSELSDKMNIDDH